MSGHPQDHGHRHGPGGPDPIPGGGVVFTRADLVANPGTAEADLYTPIIARNLLRRDGDSLEVVAAGNLLAHPNATRKLRFYFGATVFAETDNMKANTAGFWITKFTVVRQSSSVVVYAFRLDAQTTPQPSTFEKVGVLGGLILDTVDYSMRVTASTAGPGGAANQINVQLMRITFNPRGI